MLGYCSNGYRLWDLEENKLITGRDVIFDEEKTAKTLFKGQDFYQETDDEDNKEENTQEELTEEKGETTDDYKEDSNTEINLETEYNMGGKQGISEKNQSPTALKNKNDSDIEQNEEFGRGKKKKWAPKRLEDFVTNLWPSWNNEEKDYVAYALSAEEFVNNVPLSYKEI